ncbi:hypothetical protein ABS71_19180 [bacterium SCN 62-11]|mgnify:CR=1 FL=1|nr:MAG: hypothetical protein ABS71_19180 [bacterium SCN 62-11]
MRWMPGGIVRRRGVALVFTLSVGVLLIILSLSLFSFYSSEVYSQGQQQKSLQAYWNARAGLEHFCQERRVPATGVYDFRERGRCQVHSQAKDLVFEGVFGTQKRRIRLIERDPARRVEEP